MNLALPFLGNFELAPSSDHFPTLKKFGRHLKDHVVPHPRNNYHPHLLGHRAIALFSLLLVTIKIASIVLITVAPIAQVESSAITRENVISLTNQSRKEFGLPALKSNEKLRIAAQAKAEDMLAKQYFAHNTPDGKTPWDFIKASGYSYLVAGENLAVDFIEAENVEEAWMNSPGHRANILNKDFEEIGIGISQGQFEGHTSIFVVQMFGTQPVQPIQTLAQPTSVEQSKNEVVPTKTENVRVASSQSAISQPQTLALQPAASGGPQSNTVQSQSSGASPLLIQSDIPTLVTISDGKLEVLVWAPEASKVVAQFGAKGVMLNPISDQAWKAIIPLSELTSSSASVTVEVYNLQGKLGAVRVASFSDSIHSNFSITPAVAGQAVSVLGKAVDVKNLENRIYLLFIAMILVSLVVAIGIHRHVQHISLVANGSFAAIFATLLWYFG